MRPRILHVVNSLAAAGAESMLVRLALALRDDFDQEVVCVLERGPLASSLEAASIPVECLGFGPSSPNPLPLIRLRRRLRLSPPSLVQTWLYQSDLIGGLIARSAGIRNVVWNIRSADLTAAEIHPMTRVLLPLLARLSHSMPRRIICCAESAVRFHSGRGYDGSRMVLIPNGVDTGRFVIDESARTWLRLDLGLPPETPLIGVVARRHTQKDHATLLEAFVEFRRHRPDVHLVLVGRGTNDVEMQRMVAVWKIDESVVHRLGERRDIPRVTAALDLAVSSSAWGEAFPNVLAEALSCGVPVAATDVGDARIIAGEYGRIVPPRRPRALAQAIQEALERPWNAHAARAHILERYDMRRSLERYRMFYQRLLADACAA